MGRSDKGLITLVAVLAVMWVLASGLPTLSERAQDADPGLGLPFGFGTSGPPVTPRPTFTPRPVTPTATPEPTWTPYPTSLPRPTVTPFPECNPGLGWNSTRKQCESLTVITAAENAQVLDDPGGVLGAFVIIAVAAGGLWLSRRKKE